MDPTNQPIRPPPAPRQVVAARKTAAPAASNHQYETLRKTVAARKTTGPSSSAVQSERQESASGAPRLAPNNIEDRSQAIGPSGYRTQHAGRSAGIAPPVTSRKATKNAIKTIPSVVATQNAVKTVPSGVKSVQIAVKSAPSEVIQTGAKSVPSGANSVKTAVKSVYSPVLVTKAAKKAVLSANTRPIQLNDRNDAAVLQRPAGPSLNEQEHLADFHAQAQGPLKVLHTSSKTSTHPSQVYSLDAFRIVSQTLPNSHKRISRMSIVSTRSKRRRDLNDPRVQPSFLTQEINEIYDDHEIMHHTDVDIDVEVPPTSPHIPNRAVRQRQISRKTGHVASMTPSKMQTIIPESSENSESSSEDSEETPSAADVLDISDSDDDNEYPGEHSSSLIAAMEQTALSFIRLRSSRRLPFLLRNLRQGFLNHCRLMGMDTTAKAPPTVPFYIVFQLVDSGQDEEQPVKAFDEDLSSDEYRIQMESWNCPICDFHDAFASRVILDCHIIWSHPELSTTWDDRSDKITLFLTFSPSRKDDASAAPTQHPTATSGDRTVDHVPVFIVDTSTRMRTPFNAEIIAPHHSPAISRYKIPNLPDYITDPSTRMRTPFDAGRIAPHDSPATLRYETPTVLDSITDPSTRMRTPFDAGNITPHDSSAISRHQTPFRLERQFEDIRIKTTPPPSPSSASRTLQSQSRYTSSETMSSEVQIREPSAQPQPSRSRTRTPADPLGPAAEEPYLPARSTSGNIVYYSCRPSGPRLYDLLGSLPLESFGVLKWMILDIEEELFEMNHVRDEDKVMQALWYRWSFLYREKFIANFYNGMILFIDEYYPIIHQAAGWSALRVWLLGFVVNCMLTGSEVVKVLQHYETLVGLE